jgi:hypothetical protein
MESADILRCEPCDRRYRILDGYVAELIVGSGGDLP